MCSVHVFRSFTGFIYFLSMPFDYTTFLAQSRCQLVRNIFWKLLIIISRNESFFVIWFQSCISSRTAHPHGDAWPGDEGDDGRPDPMRGRRCSPGGRHRAAPRVWRRKTDFYPILQAGSCPNQGCSQLSLNQNLAWHHQTHSQMHVSLIPLN